MDTEILEDVKAELEGLVKDVTIPIKELKVSVAQLGDRLSQVEAKANRPRLGVVQGDGKIDHQALTREHKALGQFVKSGDQTELKAMAVGVDPQGGFFVMSQLSASMTKRLYDQSPIRRLSRVVTLESGDALEEPVDRGESGTIWVGETQSRPATATPDLGMLRIPLREIWASQPVTQKLLDTSFLNIGAWLEEKLTDKFSRTEGVEFVNGAHPSKPQGFMTLPTSTDDDFTRAADTLQFVVSGHASQVTADGLRDLYWGLRTPHRANATWLMSSATANAIDKLKASGTGEYLWRDSSAAGVPPTLLGRPVEFDENMPAIGAGTFPIVFADWRKAYTVVDLLGLRLVRDPFTSKPNVLFDAFKRVGGGVQNTDALKLQKVST